MSETLDMETVQKSLAALGRELAKGHSSKGTNTLAVESMAGQGGATQIFHTASNSDPGSWAGSVQRDVPENGATDSIDENGTDYNNQGQMVKGIMEKVAKGQPLTANEFSILKGFMPFGKDKGEDKDDKKDAKKAKPDDKDLEKGDLSIEHDDDDDDAPMEKTKKSITEQVASNADVADGFEVTDFLKSWSQALTKSLDSRFNRLENGLQAVNTRVEAAEGLSKSIGAALGGVGQTVVATAQRIAQIEEAPARGPKSATALNKSQNAGGDDLISKAINGDYHARAAIADQLSDLVVKGLATANDVVLFDSTGQLSAQLANQLRNPR